MPPEFDIEKLLRAVLAHSGRDACSGANAPTPPAPQPGDFVYVLGTTYPETGKSLLEAATGASGGAAPVSRPDEAASLRTAIDTAAAKGLLSACLPCGRGGLAAAFAHLCRTSGLGLHLDLRKVPKIHTTRTDEILFSESASRFVLTVALPNTQTVDSLLLHLPAVKIGFVTTVETLHLTGLSGETLLNLEIASLPSILEDRS